MFFCYIFLAVSLMNLFDVHASSSSCDEHCADKPVFTPSKLVVRYGDPASARCSVCQHACHNTLFDLEKSVGNRTINGTSISWTVDRLTEWSTSALCYYNDDDDPDHQCCSTLPVIVYQPPDVVSISFVNHTGPMLEGRQYTLQCSVQNFAPAGNLIVTFYRGQTALGQLLSKNNKQQKPVNESFTLNISTSKEDDGVQYWSEAKLEFGPEGPQLPPVMKSQNIIADVYYKPHLQGSSYPDPTQITIAEGNLLQLNCSAVANPSPSYTWMLPSNEHPHSNSSIFTINSVTSADGGLYTCTISNEVGTAIMNFKVDVQVNYIGYIIAGILLAVILIVIVAVFLYIHYYKHNRMGQYNLKDVFRFHTRHSAVPTAE